MELARPEGGAGQVFGAGGVRQKECRGGPRGGDVEGRLRIAARPPLARFE